MAIKFLIKMFGGTFMPKILFAAPCIQTLICLSSMLANKAYFHLCSAKSYSLAKNSYFSALIKRICSTMFQSKDFYTLLCLFLTCNVTNVLKLDF